MQHFVITLKNEKVKFYDRFAIFIFLLNGVGIIAALLYAANVSLNKNETIFLRSLPIVLIAYCIKLLFQKKVTQYFRSFLVSSLTIVSYWIFIGYWWIALFTFLLILLFVFTKRELKVIITSDKILYPSLPVKSIKWQDLNNLILKDRLLTIDFKNNKIIQQHIDAKSYHVNEQEFNDFCRQQLNK